MLKLISAVMVVTGISGCMQKIDLKEVELAMRVCEQNGGLRIIEGSSLLLPNAHCNNGAIFTAIKSNDQDKDWENQ